MRFKKFYPYKFDWGSITAEGYSAEMNEITLIFNCDFRNEHNASNVIQYVIGRLCYGIMNFPANSVINMTFDIRGQEIIVSKSKKFKENLLEKINNLGITNTINIDFFR